MLLTLIGARRHWVKPPRPHGVHSFPLDYELDGKPYSGFVAYPAAHENSAAPLPGVLIAHQWMGLGDMEQFRAEEMASYEFCWQIPVTAGPAPLTADPSADTDISHSRWTSTARVSARLPPRKLR